jgi:hypothetical protein
MGFEQNHLRSLQSLRLSWAYAFFFLILLGASPVARGQGAQDEEREYFFNVVYLSLADSGGMREEKPLNVKFFADQAPIHLSVRSGGISSYFSHKGAPVLYFYNENGTDEEGEIIYKPVLNVALGASGQKLVFVIAKSDGSLGARVFDTSVESFPLNTAQLLNFSKQPLLVRLGKETGDVAPSKSRNFSIEIEQRRAAINFALATNAGGQPEIIEMKRIAFTKNGRRLILVHNDPSQPTKIRHRIFPIAQPVAVENRSNDELEAENYEQYMREFRSGEE